MPYRNIFELEYWLEDEPNSRLETNNDNTRLLDNSSNSSSPLPNTPARKKNLELKEVRQICYYDFTALKIHNIRSSGCLCLAGFLRHFKTRSASTFALNVRLYELQLNIFKCLFNIYFNRSSLAVIYIQSDSTLQTADQGLNVYQLNDNEGEAQDSNQVCVLFYLISAVIV